MAVMLSKAMTAIRRQVVTNTIGLPASELRDWNS
jgi:hypothetical protein